MVFSSCPYEGFTIFILDKLVYCFVLCNLVIKCFVLMKKKENKNENEKKEKNKIFHLFVCRSNHFVVWSWRGLTVLQDVY
jgi:hypothetical protein